VRVALRDQLDRVSVSIVLNIAEGAGRFSPPDKGRFYSIARGSATNAEQSLTFCSPSISSRRRFTAKPEA